MKWSNPLYTACTALHCTALPYTTLHYTAWLLMTVRAIASRCRAFRDPSRWTCVLIKTSKYDESSCMLASYPMVFRTVWYEYFIPIIDLYIDSVYSYMLASIVRPVRTLRGNCPFLRFLWRPPLCDHVEDVIMNNQRTTSPL